MEEKIYIHWGSEEFIPKKFKKISNTFIAKPKGGLWASPENAEYGWKEFCKDSGFNLNRLQNSFKFKLNGGAKVLDLSSYRDFLKIPLDETKTKASSLEEIPWMPTRTGYPLDWKALVGKYDAIEINYSDFEYDTENEENSINEYPVFWDCDSICIINPEIIEML